VEAQAEAGAHGGRQARLHRAEAGDVERLPHRAGGGAGDRIVGGVPAADVVVGRGGELGVGLDRGTEQRVLARIDLQVRQTGRVEVNRRDAGWIGGHRIAHGHGDRVDADVLDQRRLHRRVRHRAQRGCAGHGLRAAARTRAEALATKLSCHSPHHLDLRNAAACSCRR
jgi:hypothetical protein